MVGVAGSVQVSWNDLQASDPTIASYVLQYREAGGDWQPFGAAIVGTSATIDGLTDGTAYTFQVAAVNSFGRQGDFSAESDPATPSPAASAAPAPEPEAAPASEPEAAPAPAPSTAADLDAELALVRAAQAALARDPARALEITATHLDRFPDGQLAQEREVAAIQALVALGRRDEAQARAAAFRAKWPGSAHIRRIDVLLGE